MSGNLVRRLSRLLCWRLLELFYWLLLFGILAWRLSRLLCWRLLGLFYWLLSRLFFLVTWLFWLWLLLFREAHLDLLERVFDHARTQLHADGLPYPLLKFHEVLVSRTTVLGPAIVLSHNARQSTAVEPSHTTYITHNTHAHAQHAHARHARF